jgi:Tumour-associated protein
MERALFNIHSQLCNEALRRTSVRTRRRIEYAILFAGVCAFSIVFLSHVTFVFREGVPSIPKNCLFSIPHFDSNADVIYIRLLEEEMESSAMTLTADSTPLSSSSRNSASCLPLNNQLSYDYSFSRTRGYLQIPPELFPQHNISSQMIGVSKSNIQCFGEPFLQTIVFRILGPDTVVLNWLLVLGDGLVFWNSRTGILQELVPAPHLSLWESPLSTLGQVLMEKAIVVLTAIFLFFVTTTLTSFTLRETQQRMLQFKIQLQTYVRERRSLERLIFIHILEILVFVPIMLGMMFFLIEFYRGDKVLAFMVQSVVWICEVFSVLSLRSYQGLRFLPPIFFLLFLAFHIYIFSCPHGFSYAALFSTALFLLHSMLFFWNRYELNAVARGYVSQSNPRMDRDRSVPIRPMIPNLDGTEQEVRTLGPRPHQHAFSTSSLRTGDQGDGRGGSTSRHSSGLFQLDTDDEDSCLYMLNGEIVYQRRVTRPLSPLLSLIEDEAPRRRGTSYSEETIPREDETTSPLLPRDLTPRMGTLSSRFEGRITPVFPF